MERRAIPLAAVCVAVLSFAATTHAQSDVDPATPPVEPQAGTKEVSLSYVDADTRRDEEPVTKTWQDRKWNFVLAPYLMFPFMNGSVSLANQTVDVNINTRDILKRLDYGFMFYFAANHPKFSIVTDLLYMNLKDGGTLRDGGREAQLRMQQLAAEFVFFGRITKWFEVGPGLRVNFIQSGLTAPAGMVLPAVDLDFRETWVDPLIALRFSVPFRDDHWRLALRADFGGFTVGSQYAWQAYLYGGYNFDGVRDKRVFELAVGFRALGMEYETGDGLRRFVYDMIIWGPEIGFVFHL